MNRISPEREELRKAISLFARRLMLSSRISELCETEATPRQEEFLRFMSR